MTDDDAIHVCLATGRTITRTTQPHPATETPMDEHQTTQDTTTTRTTDDKATATPSPRNGSVGDDGTLPEWNAGEAVARVLRQLTTRATQPADLSATAPSTRRQLVAVLEDLVTSTQVSDPGTVADLVAHHGGADVFEELAAELKGEREPQPDPDALPQVLPATSRQRLVGLLQDLLLFDRKAHRELCDNHGGREAVEQLIEELKADGDEVLQLRAVLDRLIREHALLKYAVNQAMTGTPGGRPRGARKGHAQGVADGWRQGVQAMRVYLRDMAAPCSSADELVERWEQLEAVADEYTATVAIVAPVVPEEHQANLPQAARWLLDERARYGHLLDAEVQAAEARLDLARARRSLELEIGAFHGRWPDVQLPGSKPLVVQAVELTEATWSRTILDELRAVAPDLVVSGLEDLDDVGGVLATVLHELLAGDDDAGEILAAVQVEVTEHHRALASWCEPGSFTTEGVTWWRCYGAGNDDDDGALSLVHLGHGPTMIEAFRDALTQPARW